MSSTTPPYQAYVTKWLSENIEEFHFLKKIEVSESDAMVR